MGRLCALISRRHDTRYLHARIISRLRQAQKPGADGDTNDINTVRHTGHLSSVVDFCSSQITMSHQFKRLVPVKRLPLSFSCSTATALLRCCIYPQEKLHSMCSSFHSCPLSFLINMTVYYVSLSSTNQAASIDMKSTLFLSRKGRRCATCGVHIII